MNMKEVLVASALRTLFIVVIYAVMSYVFLLRYDPWQQFALTLVFQAMPTFIALLLYEIVFGKK